MKPLIQQIFSAEESEAIKHLWKNPEDRRFIKDAISTRIIESDNIILGQALNQVCLVTARASFADSEEEAISVAAMIFYCLKLENVFPSILIHRGKEFSSRALISLSFYHSYMDKQCERHGAPRSDYYRKISQIYLKNEDLEPIAEHHVKWESFLAEHFC